MFKIISENWSEISLTLGGIISFFVGRKSKKNSDVAGELENIETVREIEKKLLNDMEEQIERLTKNIERQALIIEKQSRKIRKYEIKYGVLNG